MDTIPLDACKDRFIYELRARNIILGVFRKEVSGFIGIRYKLGCCFLDTEYDWETGEPYGTARASKELGKLPDDIKLKENFKIDGKLATNDPLFDYLEPLTNALVKRLTAEDMRRMWIRFKAGQIDWDPRNNK